MPRLPCSCVYFLAVVALAPAAEPTVEKVAAAARDSVVVISFTGRDGRRQGLGTGFVVGEGLVATNYHVLGEGRPLAVRLAGDKEAAVTSIHASDRSRDLAVLKVDAKGLKPLQLADSDKLQDGQAVVALGNPHGLTHSVVAGVVSGKREIDGRTMIQLAIPIEPGNSGGPLLDMQGRVHGILTMKSLVTNNLGFAVPVNALKPLLAKPNPIPMARWLTIGALDADEWTTTGGARWRQRAGRIHVDGLGAGFAGRSLCLNRKPLPQVPFEVGVAVKLDDEAGAAGLVFHADGGDKHYGFYPSAGQMRFVHFDGPEVFSWRVLRQDSTPHYRPGEWNALKVRIEAAGVKCYVNDQLVYDEKNLALDAGRVGLAKFRDTRAEFKNYQIATALPPALPPKAVVDRVTQATASVAGKVGVTPGLAAKLAPEGAPGLAVLRDRARALEEQAAALRLLAREVHQKRVLDELGKLLTAPEDQLDLCHAALLLARLDNDELDPAPYLREVERMAREAGAGLPKGAGEKARLTALNKYFFEERGYHGSRGDYYNRANSYLNEVIDDREGLPITLSVLYMDLARRLGVRVVGLSLPGHFMTRHIPADGPGTIIDVFEGGKSLTDEEAGEKVQGEPLLPDQLRPAPKAAILVRMLHNLLNNAREDNDTDGMLRYLDAILQLKPDAARERWMRALVRYQSRRAASAKEDVDWLLEHRPEGVELERVEQLRRLLN